MAHLLLGGWEVGRWDKYWFPPDSPLTPPHDRKVELQEATLYSTLLFCNLYCTLHDSLLYNSVLYGVLYDGVLYNSVLHDSVLHDSVL